LSYFKNSALRLSINNNVIVNPINNLKLETGPRLIKSGVNLLAKRDAQKLTPSINEKVISKTS